MHRFAIFTIGGSSKAGIPLEDRRMNGRWPCQSLATSTWVSPLEDHFDAGGDPTLAFSVSRGAPILDVSSSGW